MIVYPPFILYNMVSYYYFIYCCKSRKYSNKYLLIIYSVSKKREIAFDRVAGEYVR